MSVLTIAQCFFFSNEAVPLNLVTFPVDSIIAVSLFGNMTVDTGKNRINTKKIPIISLILKRRPCPVPFFCL